MISKFFGFLFIFFALVFLLSGELAATIFTLLSALSLLIMDKRINSTLAARIGKDSIPNFKNGVHYSAAFVLLGIAGATLPPQEPIQVNEPLNSAQATNTAQQVAQYRIESPACVNQIVGRMNELWLELNTFRTESDFHEHRFALERYGNWNNEREALVSGWDRCQTQIDSVDRGAFFTISVAIGGMYGLAQNWSANSGNDNDLTTSVTRDIHIVLSKNWNELYRGM